MQHFSNYFVQILAIRTKCQVGKDGPRGAKNFPSPLLSASMHLPSVATPLVQFVVPKQSRYDVIRLLIA